MFPPNDVVGTQSTSKGGGRGEEACYVLGPVTVFLEDDLLTP